MEKIFFKNVLKNCCRRAAANKYNTILKNLKNGFVKWKKFILIISKKSFAAARRQIKLFNY